MGVKQDLQSHKWCNIIKGWATSVFIGLPLVLLAFALPVKFESFELTYDPEWYMRLLFIAIGFLAMLAPNEFPSTIKELISIAKTKIGLLVILAVILIPFLVSCSAAKTIETKTNTITKYRDTTIYVPGTSAHAALNDSLTAVLKKLLAEGKNPQVIFRDNPSSPTTLKIYLDSLGNLKADCETSEQQIKLLLKEVQTLKEQLTTKTKAVIPEWLVIVLIISIAGNVISVILFIYRTQRIV